MSENLKPRLISHGAQDEFEEAIKKISARIQHEGDKPYVSVQKQLDLLNQLSQFDFGRFLIENLGINGYWSHYMITHPRHGKKTGKNNRGESFTSLETFLLEKLPLMLATQQRFEIFLKENQTAVKNGAKLACIPSGLLAELLYLDFTNIDHIELIGIDYDSENFIDAELFDKKLDLEKHVIFVQKDAWQLNYENEFDLISSNGLTIYEPDEEKISEIFFQFYRALKKEGKLVTSFVTHPPTVADQCEWDMTKINSDDLLLQKILFVDMMHGKWQCYRSSEKTKIQLEKIGFKNIKFFYDNANMFPTVVGYKY